MKRIKLGDVLDVKRGASLSGCYYSEIGDKIRLTLGNFNYPGGGFKKNTSKLDIYFNGPFKPEYLLKKGDIITPLTEQVSGLLGETATIPESDVYIQSGDIGLVIPNEKVLNKRFAYYLVSSPIVKKQLAASAQQTKIRHTSPDAIKNCEAWIPDDVCVQAKIAKMLDDINDKIALNNSICSDLESMAKLLYDYWFMQFDFPDENGRPYKSSGGKMVWNDELKREIPEGWNVTNVGQITDCLDSKRVPLSNKEREEISGIIPYYGATGIMGYVNKAIFNGDYVLLAEDGSVMDSDGHPILQRVSGECWINNHAHVLEPHDGYSCKLLMMILKDIPVVSIKTGSIQMKINQANLNDYQIVEIPSKLRKKLCEKLDVIDEQLLFLERENQELVSLRDFLLPMLMNGQIKIEDVKAS